MITKQIKDEDIEVRWLEHTDHSDHKPISVKFKHGGQFINEEKTIMATKDRRKIKRESKTLIRNIYNANNLEEVYEAFEIRHNTRIKTINCKPKNIE